ncbi:transcriptional regulator [Mangrovimicrobium sediminis]|uniref:Transcriptional regulator n=1 Tax=Mangrovimicrobium sediminis TaxID=2562682 RepID=A0A4Z0M1S8_9GAMM|nr:helix-turn-helix domain-containing protein [Haliea sp. SAOS-164]TGD73396.1 transcriptional regulator [Haliea sp. SAOS-164]
MSKPPPGVQRVVAVLNFFAEHPGQSFTFTDIVKALDLGRATCHALLAGLVEAQYLYRNTDKTYVIGPALVAVGRIASEQFSPTQATQPELRALSDRYRTACSAVYLEGHDVVIKLRAGAGRSEAWAVPQGQRLPLRAPFAGAYFATTKSYDLEKWLDEASPKPPEKERRELLAGIEFTREHGYSFGVFNPDMEIANQPFHLAFVGSKMEYPVKIAWELKPRSSYQLAFLTCPVFNRERQVEFVLNLSGFRGSFKGETIAEMGNDLREAAERLTYFINGRSEPYPLPN